MVLDTNIFISATFWQGDSYDILQLWADGAIQVIISLDIIDELYRVLSNFKIQISKEFIDNRIALIKENSIIVSPIEKFNIVEDLSDNKFIDCAIAGNASHIITNDKHLLKIRSFRNVKIITPKEFLSMKP